MRRIIISGIIASVFGLLAPQIIQAQGTTLPLQLGSVIQWQFIAVGNDSWLAVIFMTGTNAGGYSC